MKRIALVGLTGWARIVALAWSLANDRVLICDYNVACQLRVAASRDVTLTNGLTVALVGLLALMFLARQPDRWARLSRLQPTLPAILNFVGSPRAKS